MSKDIYVEYSEICVYDYVAEEEDEFSPYESTFQFEVLNVTHIAPESAYNKHFSINVPKKWNRIVYVVTVIYSSGDTFGCSHGRGCIEGVYINAQDAMSIKQNILSGKYIPKSHAAWMGYFEDVEDVKVEMFKIK